jgi:hypothetical protein
MADDFVDQLATYSCKLAQHRQSDVLAVKDVQFYLGKRSCRRVVPSIIPKLLIITHTHTHTRAARSAKMWDLTVPGFPATPSGVKPLKRKSPSASHYNRLKHLGKVKQAQAQQEAQTARKATRASKRRRV